jgi:hypothetical protein
MVTVRIPSICKKQIVLPCQGMSCSLINLNYVHLPYCNKDAIVIKLNTKVMYRHRVHSLYTSFFKRMNHKRYNTFNFSLKVKGNKYGAHSKLYHVLYPSEKEKNGRQCTYNVTSRHIHLTIVAVEKQWVLHILSGCLYTCFIYVACKDHVLCYIVICGLFGPPYLWNSTIFGKKIY